MKIEQTDELNVHAKRFDCQSEKWKCTFSNTCSIIENDKYELVYDTEREQPSFASIFFQPILLIRDGIELTL